MLRDSMILLVARRCGGRPTKYLCIFHERAKRRHIYFSSRLLYYFLAHASLRRNSPMSFGSTSPHVIMVDRPAALTQSNVNLYL